MQKIRIKVLHFLGKHLFRRIAGCCFEKPLWMSLEWVVVLTNNMGDFTHIWNSVWSLLACQSKSSLIMQTLKKWQPTSQSLQKCRLLHLVCCERFLEELAKLCDNLLKFCLSILGLRLEIACSAPQIVLDLFELLDFVLAVVGVYCKRVQGRYLMENQNFPFISRLFDQSKLRKFYVSFMWLYIFP